MPKKFLVVAVILLAVPGISLVASASDKHFSGVFIIAEITVNKDEAYQRYMKAVEPVIENCGGTYVIRAGAKFVTDNPTSALLNSMGGWNPDRIVVVHFDSLERATACFESPEYAAAYALREGGASARSLIVSAFSPNK